MTDRFLVALPASLDSLLPSAGEGWRNRTTKLLQDYLRDRLRSRTIEVEAAKAIVTSLLDKVNGTSDRPSQMFAALCFTAEEFPAVDDGLAGLRGELYGVIASALQDRARAAVLRREVGLAAEVMSCSVALLRDPGDELVHGLTRAALRKNAVDLDRLLVRGLIVRQPETEGETELVELLRDAVSLSVGGKLVTFSLHRRHPELSGVLFARLRDERDRLERMVAAEGQAVTELRQRHRQDWDAVKALRLVNASVLAEYDNLADEVCSALTRSPTPVGGSVTHLRLYPLTIYNLLREVVVSQTQALKVTSVVCFEHYLRSLKLVIPEDPKPSVMMYVGPSGSGKTYIARIACKCLGLPFAHVNASSLVGSGIIGTTLSDTVDQLMALAEGDSERARFGVLFIDEIDKVGCQSGEQNLYYAKAIQSEILMFLEGERVLVPRNAESKRESYYFDTSDLLIMFGGAFDGIERIVARRIGCESSIGFDGDGRGPLPEGGGSLYEQVTKADVIDYGFMPQLLGRVQTLTNLSPLGRGDLLEILKNNRISPFQVHHQYFAAVGDDLVVDDEVYEMLADFAAESELGARRLRDVVGFLLFDLKFVAANQRRERVHLSRGFVEQRLRAIEL